MRKSTIYLFRDNLQITHHVALNTKVSAEAIFLGPLAQD